jgi:hypothetical protein
MWYEIELFGSITLGGLGLALMAMAIIRSRVKATACPSCRKDRIEGLRCGACGYEVESERELRSRGGEVPVAILGGTAVVLALFVIGVLLRDVTRSEPAFGDLGTDPPVLYIGMLAVIGTGLAVAFWGVWGRTSRGRRRCPKCWYDMRGVPGLVCPECGRDARKIKRLYRARHRRKIGVAGVLVAVSGPAFVAVEYVREQGPLVLVPTTVMIAGVEWLPDRMVLPHSGGSRHVLYLRVYDRRLWQWQRRWLRERGTSLIANEPSGRTLVRAGGMLRMLDGDSWCRGREDMIWRTIWRTLQLPPSVGRDTTLAWMYWLVPESMSESVASDLGDELPALIGMIGDPSLQVSERACELLGAMSNRSHDAVPALLEEVAKGNSRSSSYAEDALRVLGEDSPEVRGAVLDALPSMPTAEAKQSGALSLVSNWNADAWTPELPTMAPEVADRLVAYLGSDDDDLAYASGYALCHSRAAPDKAIPVILRGALDATGPMPSLVSEVHAYGNAIAPYIDDLLALATHPDEVVREHMMLVFSFGELTDRAACERALPVLRSLLSDPTEPVQRRAEWAVAEVEEIIERSERDGSGDG